MIVRLYAAGRPAPQGSYVRGAHGAIRPASRYLADWREAVAYAAKAARPTSDRGIVFLGPVAIELRFEFRRPKGHYRADGTPRVDFLGAYPRRPDLDKLVRSTLDGLVMGAMMGDDCQVVRLEASKAYSAASGCAIRVEGVAP